jgi:uncharacterized protein
MEPAPAPPPRGDYFGNGDSWHTDVGSGVARDRAGTRVLALPEEFLDALGQTLAAECGPAAERVLKNCGRAWGRRLAERLAQELGDYHGEPLAAAPLARFQAALRGAFRALGWGVLAIDFSRYDKGLLVAEVRNAPPAAPADALLAGALAGLFSHFAGQELDGAATPAADGVRRFVLGLPQRLERVADAIHGGRSHEEVVAALEEVRV